MPGTEESIAVLPGGIEARIGYRFADRALLEQALTHRSFANDNPGYHAGDNQRLEFLGDAVLSLVVGRMLYLRFPDAAEGFLTQSRADLVNAASLAGIARRLELVSCLRVGSGLARGGADTDNILSDAFEALIGAVFLDGGFHCANQVVEGLFVEVCQQVVRHPGREDYKTRLQELLQKRWQVRPEYRIIAEEGPVHQCHYTVDVVWDGQVRGRGEGSSKKRAEQEAARRALESLQCGKID